MAFDLDHGRELWRSGGTDAGTGVVKDINPGQEDSNPQILTSLDGTLYFRANDGDNGNSLWKSDGTEKGTVLVKSFPDCNEFASNFTGYIATRDHNIYFSLCNNAGLWKSDGTEEGAVMVKDIHPSTDDNTTFWSPAGLRIFGKTLYFTANDGTYGRELWQSDGTEAGTVMVKDLFHGPTQGVTEILGGR